MDGSLNQPLMINAIDIVQPIRSMYQNRRLVKSKILNLITKIDPKDLNLSDLKLIKDFKIILEDK